MCAFLSIGQPWTQFNQAIEHEQKEPFDPAG
jgi:hypothetical protein